MVTLLEEIDPEYYKYFIYTDKCGRKCMYAEAKKAIYGILEASLLFWKKNSKSLEEMGYQKNEHDWCVMNKIIDNKQIEVEEETVWKILLFIVVFFEKRIKKKKN